ncbi:MAG: hypothetical protein ACTTH7_06670 [Treponema sp.]
MDATLLKSLGDKLKALRLQKDISQEKFTELTEKADRLSVFGQHL